MADLREQQRQELIEKIRLKRSIKAKRAAKLSEPPELTAEQKVAQRQEGRQVIPLTAPGIVLPGINVKSFDDFDKQGQKTLQSLGGVAQREESLLAAPAMALAQGKGFKEAGRELVERINPFDDPSNEPPVEIGDVIVRMGGTEAQAKVGGFLISMGLPTNLALTLMTGGAGKTATGKTGSFLSRQLESASNLFSGIQRRTVKKIRNLVDKLGAKKVFNSNVESVDFVGRELAPKATEIIRKRIKTLEPNTLRQIGIDQQTINKIKEIQKKLGIKEYLSPTEADNLWSDLFKKIPQNTRINVNKSVNAIDSIALEAGELPIAKKLSQMASRLRGGTLLDETLQSKGSVVDKTLFQQIRTELNQLARSGSDEVKRFASDAKIALDDALIELFPEFKTVKGHFAISREIDKVKNFIDDPELIKLDDPNIVDKVASKLTAAQNPAGDTKRKILESLLGKKGAEEIIDLLEANKILTSTGQTGIAQSSSSGPVGLTGRLGRKLTKTLEEKVTPKMRAAEKSAVGSGAKKIVGLAERAGVRRSVQGEESKKRRIPPTI